MRVLPSYTLSNCVSLPPLKRRQFPWYFGLIWATMSLRNEVKSMFKLDDNFLSSLGLGDMPAEEKEAFLGYVYEELELRVGTELSKDLSDEQLEQFEKLIDGGDQDAALKWLEGHCPS